MRCKCEIIKVNINVLVLLWVLFLNVKLCTKLLLRVFCYINASYETSLSNENLSFYSKNAIFIIGCFKKSPDIICNQ